MNCFFNSKKGIFLFLLLLPFFSFASNNYKSNLINKALDKNLSKSIIWKSLLHLEKNGKPSINSKSFLLSYADFSAKNELIKTIEYFFDDNKSRCKYPARYLWLKKELNLDDNKFKHSVCNDFQRYIKNTNTSELSLVFVSENVSNPSSMMGHLFFKLDGINYKGNHVQNAISFFTMIDTLNIPYLALESTVLGMDGYFVLKPYSKQIYSYLTQEDRNIWEYSLKLDPYELKLITYHFWELKQTDIEYYFTGFNCATIVNNILNLKIKNEDKSFNLWVTPKDVIKRAQKEEIIKNTSLKPSNLWNFKMLLESINKDDANLISNAIDKNDIDKLAIIFKNDKSQLKRLFALAYLEYDFYKNKNKTLIEFKSLYNFLIEKDIQIDISKYKNPIKTQNDSQVSISKSKEQKGISLKILPASHTLYDNNQQYYGESSLKIAELKLNIDDKINIEEFNLFSMTSLIPWDNYTKQFSKQLEINYTKHLDKELNRHSVYNISYSKGLTKQLSEDVIVYDLLGIGLAYGNSKPYTYIKNELGMMIYEVFDMKSTISYSSQYNNYSEDEILNTLNLTQSIKLKENIRFDIKFENNQISSKHNNDFGFELNYIF